MLVHINQHHSLYLLSVSVETDFWAAHPVICSAVGGFNVEEGTHRPFWTTQPVRRWPEVIPEGWFGKDRGTEPIQTELLMGAQK